ncbi:MAG: AAA family ATPase [Alphaproteobacteria bacterium]|nr:AAA family ATPase [Alphaproteobacteria bacterium]
MTPLRVCLVGPESTGKTTLAGELAQEFGTIFVPEFGRFYCELFGNRCDADDLRAIVSGQTVLNRAALRKADRVLILDTDALMTAIWAKILLKEVPSDLERVDDLADLYLLTAVDVPFAQDSIRYFPDPTARSDMFDRCRAELERRALPYVVISGDRAARRLRAKIAIVDRLRHGSGTT